MFNFYTPWKRQKSSVSQDVCFKSIFFEKVIFIARKYDFSWSCICNSWSRYFQGKNKKLQNISGNSQSIEVNDIPPSELDHKE